MSTNRNIIKKIEYTGERITNTSRSDLFLSTQARYEFAKKYISSKNKVLDMGCGTGYGSYLLSKKAKQVIGVDVDKESIEYCASTYQKNNLSFQLIHPSKRIESFKHSFDVIVSYETIEHVKDAKGFLKNLHYYLKENGILILSTPNNFYYQFPPSNQFHIYEFNILELLEILKQIFHRSKINVFGQHKMVTKKNDPQKRETAIRSFVKHIILFIYLVDKKTFNILNTVQHWSIYKQIGRLQRDEKFDVVIYPISPEENFFIPRISMYVVYKNSK